MGMPPAQPPPTQPSLTYVDRVEVSETFAHSLRRLTFDGANIYLEFVVNRMDDPQPPRPPTGNSVTTCRLVLPLIGALELSTHLNALMSSLRSQGLVPVPPPGNPGRPTLN